MLLHAEKLYDGMNCSLQWSTQFIMMVMCVKPVEAGNLFKVEAEQVGREEQYDSRAFFCCTAAASCHK